MSQKTKLDIKEQIDKVHREMERKCDKDYPKSRVCYVDIRKGFK